MLRLGYHPKGLLVLKLLRSLSVKTWNCTSYAESNERLKKDELHSRLVVAGLRTKKTYIGSFPQQLQDEKFSTLACQILKTYIGDILTGFTYIYHHITISRLSKEWSLGTRRIRILRTGEGMRSLLLSWFSSQVNQRSCPAHVIPKELFNIECFSWNFFLKCWHN